jgi:hypothetical protein
MLDALYTLTASLYQWLTNDPKAMLVFAAGLPVLPLLIRLSPLALLGLMLAIGGLLLAFYGMREFQLIVLLLGANTLLVEIDGSLTRKKLANVEQLAISSAKAIHMLETAEERRRVFTARQLTFGAPLIPKTSDTVPGNTGVPPIYDCLLNSSKPHSAEKG